MPRPRADAENGVVLNMTLSGDGIWNAIYSIDVLVGKNQQQFQLSVDTGSSDLWIASSQCSTSECSSSHTTLYDSSTSMATGQDVDLNYLRGGASGPIVWDIFKIGPYVIPSQALAAATEVTNERLSSDFVGIIGLALPPNSLIAQKIPATESDAPDGATLQQNLFGLTPVSAAPENQFFGISLERPGSSHIPSLLSIGKHPTGLIPGLDSSKIQLGDLVISRLGDTYWKTHITSITGWVDGQEKPIMLGRSSLTDSTSPVAIVDTGGAVILATRSIANAIYGAWQIGPASDGNYYVPCTTPLNMSISLGQFPPIPLHPLDLTAPPPNPPPSADPSTCLGVIQASDDLGDLTDMILGVPFMRNVYTVLSSTSPSSPQLGLFPLTDPTTAMDQFHSVRVLGQPLDPSDRSPASHSSSTSQGKKPGVGIIVLVSILGFFIACALLFGVRWWVLRRKFRRMGQTDYVAEYGHKRRSSDDEPDEETLRNKRWEEGKKKGHFYTDSTTGSDFTQMDQLAMDELGVHKVQDEDEHRDTHSRSRSPTVSVRSNAGHTTQDPGHHFANVGDWETPHVFHVRTASHLRDGSITATPLLDEAENRSGDDEQPSRHRRMVSTSSGIVSFHDDVDMAGIGTRGSIASSSRRVPRPRGARTTSSGSATSSLSHSRGVEVGEVLDPVELT